MKTLAFSCALVVLGAIAVPAAEVVITLNETNTYQEMEGFGGSLTDSSCWLFDKGISGAHRTNLLKDLFSTTNGIGLSFLRQPMGSSDFRLQNYTYDDLAAGRTDYNLTNFSVAYEQSYILPVVKQAMTVNTNLKIMGTPWSAPAWMKSSNDFYAGTLKTNCFDVYATYFRRYVQTYASNGVPVHAVTLQNEPLYEPKTYPGMTMSSTSQVRFARLVAAQFLSNGIATKIFCYDHNWDHFEYPVTVLNDTGAAAVVAGSAFHGYGGDVSAQSAVHDAHTNKDIYFTEMTAGTWATNFADNLVWDTSTLIIGAIRNWAKTVIKWNIALDQNGGPKIAGGCSGCRGLITINTNTHVVATNADYYVLGHASKFVRRGARRIESSETPGDGPYSVAFINPDSSLVVVALNDTNTVRNFTLHWNQQSLSYPIPAKSVATFTWPNVSGATADVWVTSGDRSRLLQKQAGALQFHPLQIAWKGRTWTVRDGQGNPGGNYWSASCVAVDTNDYLHLKVKYGATGVWYCGQVDSTESPGFGTYRWYTVGRMNQLDSNLVGSLSTYYDLAHELDIQFAYAYDDEPTNVAYVVQPYYLAGHRASYAHAFTNDLTTHEFVWNPRTVTYRSWYGHTPEPSPKGGEIQTWTYEGDDVPGDTNELIRMNLWMYNALAPASSQELVVADFFYQASTGSVLFDDFEDASLAGFWKAFGGGTLDESGGDLQVTPPDSAGASGGARATNVVFWTLNGLSYIFSANLSTANVTASRGAGGPDVWAYQALVSGSNGVFDPYAASNAVTLRAGYDASTNVLTLELLTKTDQANSWGTSRFVGTIDNASSFFNGSGLELRLTLVYSNVQVSAYYGGSAVLITTVSGSPDTPHGLSPAAFTNARYVVGAQNNDDGRGTVFWEQAQVRWGAELPSAAVLPDGNGESSLVQIGNGDNASTWRNPVGTKYNKLRSQVLYRANQIGQPGTITQIQIKVVSPPDIALSDFAVRMQHTAAADLSLAFTNSGWIQVFRASTNIPKSFSGWMPITLQTNFYYNGQQNLLVDFIVNNSTRDDYPAAAVTYTAGSGVQGTYAGNNSGDPFTWTNTSAKKYQYTGNNYVDIRLAMSNDPPPVVGANLSFEDGPRGYLTNVPGWHVIGSELSGLIKGSPVCHGTNSLKLWKGPDNGDQKLGQFFAASASNQYVLSGYILALGSEPFEGSNAYGALQLEWYNGGGPVRTNSSAYFTPTSTFNVWTYSEVAATPPVGVTSGRIVCALGSCDDQEGSLFFDNLGLTYGPAPPQTGAIPVAIVYHRSDEFDDNAMSNCWTVSWGGGPDAYVQETNGHLRVKPGTSFNQSTGYTTPVTWDNTSVWYVFSATLTTIVLDSAKSGNDIAALLGICSQADNPWWCTNSVGLYGYYDRDIDQFWWQLLTKADAPAANGVDRFNCTMTNVSSYLDGTNRLRVSVALGLGHYEVRFNDGGGLPVPYQLNNGSPRGDHGLGSRLDSSYWFVGAQADVTNRGWVYWDRTAVYEQLAPTAVLFGARQTSTDGSGIVTVTNGIGDPNGDDCRLQVEASTNGGATWFSAWADGVSGDFSAAIASTQIIVQAVHIVTTNSYSGLASTNRVRLSWNTRSACNGHSLSNRTLTNVLIRVTADDGDVSSATVAGPGFPIDNEPPAHAAASVLVETGAVYTFNADLSAAWSGFTDAGGNLAGYYSSLSDGGGTTSGTWTAETNALVAAVPDATNTVFVWGADAYGNAGAAVSDSVIVLSTNGDFDADDMPSGWELANDLDPMNGADGALDPDVDGQNNRMEFYFDTDPGMGSSCLVFEGAKAEDGSAEYLVQWNSSLSRSYSLYRAGAMGQLWDAIPDCSNVAGTGGTMVYTDSTAGVEQQLYKVGARVP